MLDKNIIKYTELFLLGFTFPVLIIFLGLSEYILIFLWLIFFYTLVLYFFLYKQKKEYLNFFKIKQHKNFLLLLIVRWLLLSALLFFFTYFFFPERLFIILKKDIALLYKILILYPFFSAFPQEFIFCTFFFKRYANIFKTEKKMIIMCAMVFCFAHIFVINWIAPLLGIFGGYIFASTYKKTKSLLIVSIEHALYGNTIFFLGLGWFFWGGSVVN